MFYNKPSYKTFLAVVFLPFCDDGVPFGSLQYGSFNTESKMKHRNDRMW